MGVSAHGAIVATAREMLEAALSLLKFLLELALEIERWPTQSSHAILGV